MTLNLSTLSILLGLGVAVPQLYGIANPQKYAASVRRFPRSISLGVVLMLLGTGWFLYYVSQMSVSDFAAYKTPMMIGFAAVGIGTCIYVQDFLAVRGLAVVLLLLAKLMVDTGRPMLPVTHWTWVIQTWAYVLVVIGFWLTISPWRLRDFLNWTTANERRVRIGSVMRLAFGLFIVVLGIVKY